MPGSISVGTVDGRIQKNAISRSFRPGSEKDKLSNVPGGPGSENRSRGRDADAAFDFAKLRVEVAVVVRA